MLFNMSFTNISSCSHPEQLLRLSSSKSVKVWWVDWLYLNGDLISQQFVKALFCILCQVWFTVKQQREIQIMTEDPPSAKSIMAIHGKWDCKPQHKSTCLQ